MSQLVDDFVEFSTLPRDTLRRFGWAVGGLALLRGKGLLALPAALWILGPAGYGRYTVALVTATAIAPFLLLNVPDGAGRMVVGAPDRQTAAARVEAIRRASLAVAACTAAVGVALYPIVGGLTAWAVLLAAAGLLFKGSGVHLQYFQRTKRLILISVVAEYCAVAAGLILALFLGVNGMLIAAVAATAGSSIYAWRTLQLSDRQPPEGWTFWGPAMRLSLPLLPVAIASWALFSLDSLLVFRLRGSSETGAYSAAYSLASIALLLPLGINTIWAPTAQRLLRESFQRLRSATIHATGLAVVVGLLLVITFIAAKPLMSGLLGQQTYSSVPRAVPWIAGGFVALALAKIFEGFLYCLGYARLILGAYVAGATANLVANYIFIPKYGMYAAAVTTTAGYAVVAILTLLFMLIVSRNRG